MQSIEELKQRVENVDLWAYSTNDDRCDNCKFYRALKEDIGYCAHRDVDGAPSSCLPVDHRSALAKRRGVFSSPLLRAADTPLTPSPKA